MGTRGLVYLVTARRPDGGWIRFRTCDVNEATEFAERLSGWISVE